MAKGIIFKHTRKAGAFVNGELQAGEWGLDVTNGTWYFSRNGTTVETMVGSTDAETLGGVAASEYATKAFATAVVDAVIDAAPGTLDTLNEFAAAIGDDANYAATMTAALAGKANSSHTHNALDVNAGDLAAARMQANVAAALQAGSGTVSNAALVLDGGSI